MNTLHKTLTLLAYKESGYCWAFMVTPIAVSETTTYKTTMAAQSLTTNRVQSVQTEERPDIDETLPDLFLQPRHQNLSGAVEHFQKILQHLEVERGRDYPPVLLPLGSGGRQETFPQPSLEVSVG